MTNFKKFLISSIIVILLALVVVILLALVSLSWRAKEVAVQTDKKNYQPQEALKVNISNNLAKDVCFSSCYPYELERKTGEEWRAYEYIECGKPNLSEKCIEPRKKKGFELILYDVEKGLHRLVVPLCVGCQIEKGFKEAIRLYSNDFLVE